MNVLITGGAGYIGSALAERLNEIENIESIYVYDNLSSGRYNFFTNQHIKNGKVKAVIADLFDTKALQKVVDKVDVVYHLAAKVSIPDKATDSQYFEQVNHWGTANLVSLIENASHIKSVIYSSSAYVYGNSDSELNESSPLLPNSFYGTTKLQGENHLKRLTETLDVYTFRIGNVFGYSRCIRWNVIINQILFNARYKNMLTILGSGNQVRPFIHIDNLVNSLSAVLDKKLEPGTYNLAEKNYSINDIVESVIKLYPELEYQYLNQHINMGSIIYSESSEVKAISSWDEKSIEKRLEELNSHFI